jgi:7,8-dihydropterin-6-yl-methyl-4-(beta-D-ribofuranosyl)aminobenzene 5'-phosphate synthase
MPSSAISNLVEVDSLTIQVIVNNEVDPISNSTNPNVKQTYGLMGPSLSPIADPKLRGGAQKELRMDSICCGAHGLSLLITTTKDGISHSVLFDTGPEEDVWEKNVSRLGLDLSAIDTIVLSHWHRDHSGAIPRATWMINSAKRTSTGEDGKQVVVDLHPDRPAYRGFMANEPISLEADPTFEEIKEAGGTVITSDETHSILEDNFLISGLIPRHTTYETGVRSGLRLNPAGAWEKDELILDERLLMCNLKGKGLVVFTGCSHAGVVNVSRHARDLGRGVPLFAVVGGYHLADAVPDKLEQSMLDLKALGPKVLMPGHCTGWRFHVKIEEHIPGCTVPLFGGTKYELA